jgi:hypothetical protein
MAAVPQRGHISRKARAKKPRADAGLFELSDNSTQ